MSTSIFICQLPQDKQKQIEKSITNFLKLYGYNKQEIQEISENAMCSRLCDLSENININDIIK